MSDKPTLREELKVIADHYSRVPGPGWTDERVAEALGMNGRWNSAEVWDSLHDLPERVTALRAECDRMKEMIEAHNKHMGTIPTMKRPSSMVEGLRILADWFDALYPNDSETHVQDDLRRWANEAERNALTPAGQAPEVSGLDTYLDTRKQRSEIQDAQFSELKGPSMVHCADCDRPIPVRFAYHCFFCGLWFCGGCSEAHFGKRPQHTEPAPKEE